MSVVKFKTPTALVLLGATGDLAEKKIIPSLYYLYEKGKLPEKLRIIGFSRRDWNDEQFRKYVSGVVSKHIDKVDGSGRLASFTSLFDYYKGNFDSISTFKDLSVGLGKIDDDWSFCTNKLFYLAVPPKYYKTIFTNLSKSGLTKPCGPEEGWTRVIVEKPFGKDYDTARKLDRMLKDLFKEEQIYRIDHYLGKDMVQNILAFRFSNNIFEQSWNNKYIEKIEVKILERAGVGQRGMFYDGVGALRDVGQNHLLQMLSLVTMEAPKIFNSEQIRRSREEIIKTVKVPSQQEVASETYRAQYDGYTDVDGVDKDSKTETYFKSKVKLMDPRWAGVGITLEAGKSLGEQKKEIVVSYKHPTPCLCPSGSNHSYHNKVIFALEPKEEVTFRLWTKKPGFRLNVERRSFDLAYRKDVDEEEYAEEYEKLLLDCFLGDQTLFVSTNEVESMWKYADPIIKGWENDAVPLGTYEPGTVNIREKADSMIEKKASGIIKKHIGIVGLGKMGGGIALNLIGHDWEVTGYNRSSEVTKKLEIKGLDGVITIEELVKKLPKPRVVWMMVPAGKPVDLVTDELLKYLEKGDVILDGGNSFYKETVKRYKKASEKGINLVDVGVSGGPNGARYGACLMVGGSRKLYEYLLPLYVDLSVAEGHEHFEGAAAGHFVKMVHNGIEYGMMQSIAEGFDLMKNADFKLHLKNVASVYNHGSVIESSLMRWMSEAYEIFDDDLESVSGAAGAGGSGAGGTGVKSEGAWTVEVAKSIGTRAEVIDVSVKARVRSRKKPNYQGKVINALRNRFGGHVATKDGEGSS